MPTQEQVIPLILRATRSLDRREGHRAGICEKIDVELPIFSEVTCRTGQQLDELVAAGAGRTGNLRHRSDLDREGPAVIGISSARVVAVGRDLERAIAGERRGERRGERLLRGRIDLEFLGRALEGLPAPPESTHMGTNPATSPC